jgi:hypothetical protein
MQSSQTIGLLPRLRSALKSLLISAGVDLRMKTEDRRILEDTILPAIARSDEYRRVLFIGCDWYTRGYVRLFTGRDYWTLEIDPAKRKYGAKQHILDSAENIAQYFEPDSLDAILCNGVIGWGLNSRDGIERMLEGCWNCLRTGGLLLIGWNDVSDHKPLALSDLKALQRFQPLVFPELGAAVLRTDTDLRHTYNFYVKAAGD